MGLIRNFALGVLTISVFTFVALFGRLPALRKTPVGHLHRLLWERIPRLLRRLDGLATGGCISTSAVRIGSYLVHRKHPFVLIFFLGLLTASSSLMLFSAWHLVSTIHHVIIALVLPLPYYFTYLCTSSSSSQITASNHATNMRLYPYDYIIYHPERHCRSCHFLKPARSKHCSLCGVCVARFDHHCVWVNNCLGKANYKFFLCLLLSLGALLSYGAYVAYMVIVSQMSQTAASNRDTQAGMGFPPLWVSDRLMSLAVAVKLGGIGIAGVGLLSLLTAPLPFGLLAYHVYLIWAGMTTNESGKWADWRDDMRDGIVYLGRLKATSGPADNTCAEAERKVVRSGETYSIHPGLGRSSHSASTVSWPLRSRHILARTDSALSLPLNPYPLVEVKSWTQCWSLAEVENIYDLGFWDNLIEVIA